jgi:Spy/CpxP family protein refolding chaperone
MSAHRIISIIILIVTLAAPFNMSADDNKQKKMDRKEWFNQMRVYKHDFLTKELSLTQAQQDKFFPLYDAMAESIEKAQRDSRSLERKINKSKTEVTDLEYEKATEAVIDTRAREVQIAKDYYAKFKGILSAEQIYKLTQAERRFTRELMKQHSNMKQKAKKS